MKTSIKIGLVVLTTTMLSAMGFSDVSVLKPGVRYTHEAERALRAMIPFTGLVQSSMVYHGGPVLSNAKVIAVLWGQGIDPNVVAGIGPFYKALISSTYYDWMTEYNTNINSVEGQPGTNQTIGKAKYLGNFAISPSVSGKIITDTQIQDELALQISSKHLPAPDANTVYMIDFPAGSTISSFGMNSCVDFCAYHNSFTNNTTSVYYGVLPDSSDPACIKGCGPATTDFQVITTDASHELGEVITDAEVDQLNPHFAWQLVDGSEIGDPQACVTDIQNLNDAIGAQFQVQGLWSGKRNACVFGP